jgi:hypothetical protein
MIYTHMLSMKAAKMLLVCLINNEVFHAVYKT